MATPNRLSVVIVATANLTTNLACREITRVDVGIRSIRGKGVLEHVEVAGCHALGRDRLDIAGRDRAGHRSAWRAISLPSAAAEEDDDAAGNMAFAKVDMSDRHRRAQA